MEQVAAPQQLAAKDTSWNAGNSMVSHHSSSSELSKSRWGRTYSACAGQGQQRKREQGTHPGSLGVWAPTTTAPGLISDELKWGVIPGCVCRNQRWVPRCSRPWAVDVVAVGWMMLGGLELVEVGGWGRNVNSRYAQAGWQGGRQGSLPDKEIQLPEAKLWFVTAQDSPSKITWARPARPAGPVPSVSQGT